MAVTFYIGRPSTSPTETATRIPRHHSGWQSVRYKGRRYQLFGGIRGPFYITLDMPIGGAVAVALAFLTYGA